MKIEEQSQRDETRQKPLLHSAPFIHFNSGVTPAGGIAGALQKSGKRAANPVRHLSQNQPKNKHGSQVVYIQNVAMS